MMTGVKWLLVVGDWLVGWLVSWLLGVCISGLFAAYCLHLAHALLNVGLRLVGSLMLGSLMLGSLMLNVGLLCFAWFVDA